MAHTITAIKELIDWMDNNKGYCTYGTIRAEAKKLFEKEKNQIIDARIDGYNECVKVAQGKIPFDLHSDDKYYTQKFISE